MPSDEIDVNLVDMVLCFARAIDFLHPAISEHHMRVAYLATTLSEELGFNPAQVQDMMIAGALHDLAAVCSPAWTGLFNARLAHEGRASFEVPDEVNRHGVEAYLMLREFQPFGGAACAIRFHHVDWAGGRGCEFSGVQVGFGSHVLRLADHLSTLPDDDRNVLEQADTIRATIRACTPAMFHPEAVRAFESISRRESFWLDLVSRHKEHLLKRRFSNATVLLDIDGLLAVSRIFGRIIDYRSSFTATHSSGVAATSEYLAARLGMGATQRRLVGVAGYLHDIGKLAVPSEILDKPGRLTAEEALVVRQHPYYTRQILSMVAGLEEVTTWASLHHERLDGTGYPFHPQEIPPEARIIAVADVFTAITENRPYRPGMGRADCLAVLDKLAAERALDGDIVAVLRQDFDEMHNVRSFSQQRAATGGAAFLAPQQEPVSG